jgi:hypothetical protein
VVLDLDRVIVNPTPSAMLGIVMRRIAAAGHRIALVGDMGGDWDCGATRHPDRDAALAWAEDELLRELARAR